MVEFGKQLKQARRSEWKSQYVDYDRLKEYLKKSKPSNAENNKALPRRHHSDGRILDLEQQEKNETAQSSKLLAGHIKKKHPLFIMDLLGWKPTELAALEFRHALDQEIEKVVLFLLEQQGVMAKALSDLAKGRIECAEEVSLLLQEYHNQIHSQYYHQYHQQLYAPAPKQNTEKQTTTKDNSKEIQRVLELLRRNYQGYQDVAGMVLAFVSYVELNVTAVRKILKKHDKNHPHQRLTHDYLSKFALEDIDSHLDQLYNDGGLSALVATLTNAFEQLHQMELSTLMMVQTKYDNTQHRRTRSVPSLAIHSSSFETDESGGADSPMISGGGPGAGFLLPHEASMPLEALKPSAMITLESRPPQDLPCHITSDSREPLLDQIRSARQRLKQTTKYAQVVAAQALMMFDDELEEYEEDLKDGRKVDRERTRGEKISSFLNLMSTFLYMTNYYIVAPTTGEYARRLGSSGAMAGIIIGMTPNAALISTVLYGWWSNYHYKPALVFAAGSSILGNICYAIALKHNSLTLVMMGRFFNGFGSARSINRRFIADSFSRSQRTAASADFVTAGALGMAAGPAIAAILGHFVDDGNHVDHDGAAANDDDNDQPLNLLWNPVTAPGWVMMTVWSIYFVAAIFFFEEPDRSHIFGKKKQNNSSSSEGALELTAGKPNEGETRPLLMSKTTNGEDVTNIDSFLGSKEPPLYTNAPVMMTMWIYFILKLTLETLLSSCASVTSFFFAWGSQTTGIFLAFLGLLMFPANLMVAKLSQRYEDREIIYGTLILLFVSVLGIISYGGPRFYSPFQYVLFGMCVFLSANALEGPNMSLLSKTIPPSWAKGTFNSGFLATEAGTAARSVGDVLISLAFGLAGVNHLIDATFIPLLGLILVTIFFTRKYFEQMMESDSDDDSTSNKTPDRSFGSRQNSSNNL